MQSSIRLVCGECLRSADFSGNGTLTAPEICTYCGGKIEERSVDSAVETILSTPGSLELTPEEELTWPTTPGQGMPANIGRFQLRELLGGGGFGDVYRAYDPRLDREVALKVLKQPQPVPRILERFFREARAAAQLDHTNIVTILDAGRDEGRCWIAYQYIPGQTLARLAEKKPIDFVTAARIIRQLADALDHAHGKGIFHRDVKPANVIMDEQGRPRLTDFGLARRLEFEPTLTREGTVLGTPAYIPPEQADGRSHLADARSDIYSLGVMFHEMLCGRRPGGLPSSGVPAWKVEQAAPLKVNPKGFNPKIPPALNALCKRALAHSPADRYPDARALLVDLDRWLKTQGAFGFRLRVAGASAFAVIVLATWLVAGGAPGKKDALPENPGRSAHDPDGLPAGPVASKGDPSKKSAEPPALAAPAGTIVGNKGSKTYHRSECSSIRRMSAKNKVEFAGAEAAKAQGYLPCSICRPDAATAR